MAGKYIKITNIYLLLLMCSTACITSRRRNDMKQLNRWCFFLCKLKQFPFREKRTNVSELSRRVADTRHESFVWVEAAPSARLRVYHRPPKTQVSSPPQLSHTKRPFNWLNNVASRNGLIAGSTTTTTTMMMMWGDRLYQSLQKARRNDAPPVCPGIYRLEIDRSMVVNGHLSSQSSCLVYLCKGGW